MAPSPLDVQLTVPEDDGTVQLTVIQQYGADLSVTTTEELDISTIDGEEVALEINQSYGVDVYVLDAPGLQVVLSGGGGEGNNTLVGLSDTDIDLSTIQDQQPLVYDSSIQKWKPGTPSSASIVPVTTSNATGTLAPGGIEDFGIELGSVFQLLSFFCSNPAWIRLYGTSSAREADTRSAPGGMPPLSGTDFYAELVTVNQDQKIRLSPIPTIQSWYGTTFARIVNMGNTSVSLNCEFNVLPFVPSPIKLNMSCLLEPGSAINTELNFNNEEGLYGTATGLHYGSANEYWLIQTSDDESIDFVNDSYEIPLTNESPTSMVYVFTPDPLDATLGITDQINSMVGLEGIIPELTVEFILRTEEDNDLVMVLALGDWILALTNYELAWTDIENSFNQNNTIQIPPASYESFTHFAAVYYEDRISLFVDGVKIGTIGTDIPAPVVTPQNLAEGKLGLGLILAPPITGTVIPTAVKGIRFTSRALYFENFSPPSSISSLIPEFT